MRSKDYEAGYSAGYRAGRKVGDKAFWQQAFFAALQGTLAGPNTWKTEGKTWHTGSDYVRGAADIANRALEQAKKQGMT